MKKVLFAGMIVLGTFAFNACENKSASTETTDTTSNTTTEESTMAPADTTSTMAPADSASTTPADSAK